MYNKVILMGRLTKDPDVRYTQGEQPNAIARFTLAVNRQYQRQGDEEQADFISCVAFGGTAEFIEKYFHKGNSILVEGRIQTGSYTNRDGQKVYTTDVMVEKANFTGEKRESQQQAAPAAPAPADNGGEFMSIPEGVIEELPFN